MSNYNFSDNKARHEVLQGAITRATYFESYTGPIPFNFDRSKVYTSADCVSFTLVITPGAGLTTTGMIGTVRDLYRPGVPLLFPIYRDAMPYDIIGTLQISAAGEMRYYFPTAPTVGLIINGNYPVKAHT